MRLPCTYFCFIWIQIVSNFMCASGQTNEGYVQTSEMGWWEARKSCLEEGNTDLFVPSNLETIRHSLQIENETYYWVGGFEASQWRWTDNSPLFTDKGLYDIPSVHDDDIKDIPGNSVLECYRECNENRIGLRGSQCYCLEWFYIDENNEDTGNIEYCPGNQEEECGTRSSMSVYEIDIDFEIASNGDYQCGYVHEYWYLYLVFSYIKVGSRDCNKTLQAVCVNDDRFQSENKLSLTYDSNIWSLSNQTCTLAKVTHSKKSEFVNLLEKSSLYWVGLHKSIKRYWTNGGEVQHNFPIERQLTDPGPRCLALIFYSTGWHAYWIPCSQRQPSLCTRGENSSETVDVWSNGDSMLTEPLLPTTDDQNVAGTVDGDTLMSESSDRSIGIIVGVIIGVIIVASLIFTVIILKRTGKFCFKKSGSKDHTIAMDNIAYMSPNSLHNNDVIHGSDQRGYGESTTRQRRPGNDDKKLTSEEGDDYDTTNVKRNVDTGNHYNHLGADEDNYDTAGVNRIDNVQDNTYNHTVGNHVAKVDNGQSRQDTETYNHLGVGSGVGKTTRDADQCYNHLVTDVDNDYDTTRPVVDNVQDDTYNHTGSVSESRGNDAVVKLSMKDASAENSSDYYNM